MKSESQGHIISELVRLAGSSDFVCRAYPLPKGADVVPAALVKKACTQAGICHADWFDGNHGDAKPLMINLVTGQTVFDQFDALFDESGGNNPSDSHLVNHYVKEFLKLFRPPVEFRIHWHDTIVCWDRHQYAIVTRRNVRLPE